MLYAMMLDLSSDYAIKCISFKTTGIWYKKRIFETSGHQSFFMSDTHVCLSELVILVRSYAFGISAT